MERINWTDFKGGANPLSEVYRIIRVNLQSAAAEKKAKVIAFTATNIGTDANSIVAELAVSLALSGQRVLVVDCNLSQSSQHILFALPNQGLTESIAGGVDLHAMVQHCMEQERLDVLTAGASVANTEEILLNDKMLHFLSTVREEYDYVLLNMPPISQNTDAIAIGPKADGVVLVVACVKDKINAVNEAKRKLEQAGAKVLGCILDKVAV